MDQKIKINTGIKGKKKLHVIAYSLPFRGEPTNTLPSLVYK
jgi:hypothetical protein